MRTELVFVCCVVVALAGGFGTAAGQYNVGDRVVVIRDAEVGVRDRTVDKVFPGLVLPVLSVNGKWLEVRRYHTGWLDSRHVIPLSWSAIDHFDAAIRNRPGDARMYQARAFVWQALGELDRAISDLNQAIQLAPSAPLYSHRGVAWAKMGDYDKAIIDHNEALRLDPKHADAYVKRGMAWGDKGDHDKAIIDFNEALRLNPKDGNAYALRGLAWVKKDKYDRAMTDFNDSLQVRPKISEVYIVRGTVFQRQGDYDKAITDYNEALRLNPKHAKAYVMRGSAWADKHDYEKAITDYNEAFRLDPKHASAANALAWLQATCPNARYRDGEKALKHAILACELTGWKDPNMIDTLAAACAQRGDFANAIEYQKKAYDMAPHSKKAEFQLRLDLYGTGQPFREENKTGLVLTAEARQ